MKKPLVFLTILYILGIVFGLYVSIPVWVLLLSLLVTVAGAYFFLNNARIFFLSVLAAFFLMGAFSFSLSLTFPEDHIKNYTPSSGLNVVLSGTVITEPVYKKNKSVFIINAKNLKILESTLEVSGKVLVWCFKENQINIHDHITAQGKLYQPFPFDSGKKLNYRDYLAQKAIYSQFSISGGSVLITEKKRGSNVLLKGMQRLKGKIRGIIDVNLSASASGLISAMILGDRTRVPDILNESLQRSGTVHVLAVSGLHTGIIILIALLFFRMFAMHYRLRYILVILVLAFYCWFTGNRISVFRATIMASVFLLGEIINRDYDPMSALSLSALIILWVNPAELFNVGFQLSFCSVLSIFLISNKIIMSSPLRFKEVKAIRFLIQGFSVSLGAWIGTVGIVAYYFNIFTPISVMANIIIIPLLFLIILSAVLFIFLGGIIPGAASVLALNCEFFTVLLYKVNSLLISIPMAYLELADISLKYVFLYYIILSILCFYESINCRQSLKHAD